jgi:hypothetical protein
MIGSKAVLLFVECREEEPVEVQAASFFVPCGVSACFAAARKEGGQEAPRSFLFCLGQAGAPNM